MDCKKVRSFYTLFRDDNLDALTKSEVTRHVHVCQECKRLFASLDKITTVAGTFKEAKPKESVIEQVLGQFENDPVRRWFLAPRWVVAYAVVILFIAGFSVGLKTHLPFESSFLGKVLPCAARASE